MEKDQGSILVELFNLLVRAQVWFFYILIGMIGKLGMMMQSHKKTSGWEKVGSVLVAGFIGAMASVLCAIHFPVTEGHYSLQAAILVPMATVFSENVMTFLLNGGWNSLMKIFMKKSVTDNDKDLE